jgi:hypothetical protein
MLKPDSLFSHAEVRLQLRQARRGRHLVQAVDELLGPIR